MLHLIVTSACLLLQMHSLETIFLFLVPLLELAHLLLDPVNQRVQVVRLRRELQDLLPGIINQLGPDNLANVKKLAETYQGGGAPPPVRRTMRKRHQEARGRTDISCARGVPHR